MSRGSNNPITTIGSRIAIAGLALAIVGVIAAQTQSNRKSAAPQAEAQKAVERYEPYERIWRTSGREIERSLEALDAWAAQPEGERAQPPQALMTKLGFEDPDPHKTRVAVLMSTKTEAEARSENWRRFSDRLRRLANEKIGELLTVSTHATMHDKWYLIKEIGAQAAHPAFVPLLLATCRNEAEKPMVRTVCAYSLGFISYDNVIPDLTSLLAMDEPEVGAAANERLVALTGFSAANEIALRTGSWHGRWKELIPAYEKWWAKHKDTFSPDREKLRSGVR